MERIKKAVELAKANRSKVLGQQGIGPPLMQRANAPAAAPSNVAQQAQAPLRAARSFDAGVPVKLNKWQLHSNRIVADDGADPRGRPFEMLRTHLVQRMQEANFNTVGITSPTAGCGKTVCSINLALTIARLPEKSVTLIDMDLRKPQIANYLGFKDGPGIEAILRGEAKLSDVALIPGGMHGRIRILPNYRSSREAAELMTSNKMRDLVQQLRSQDPTGVIIFDLPPVLLVDDVLSFMPNLDCILLVAASGQTTMNDLVNTERIVGHEKIIGVVLNKSEDDIITNSYY
jgi:Mrp family chromosome partitioning ATPase